MSCHSVTMLCLTPLKLLLLISTISHEGNLRGPPRGLVHEIICTRSHPHGSRTSVCIHCTQAARVGAHLAGREGKAFPSLHKA